MTDPTSTSLDDHLYAIWSAEDMDSGEFEYRKRQVKALLAQQVDEARVEGVAEGLRLSQQEPERHSFPFHKTRPPEGKSYSDLDESWFTCKKCGKHISKVIGKACRSELQTKGEEE